MGVLALHRQLLHPLQSAGAHKRLAPVNRGSAPGSPVPRAHVALALRPRPGHRSAVSCFALLAPTQHLTIPVGISILHLCPSWGNGHGTELELTPSPANPRSRDPGVCQATHVACPPCPGTRECARAAEQASPESLGSGADGRTSLPQGLPQASVRAPPPGSDLFLGSRCGSAAALHVVFLGQSVQVQLLSPHQGLPNLRGRLMHRGTPAGHSSRPGLVIPTSRSASWAVSGPQKSVTSGSLAASLKSGANDITLRLIVTGTPGSLSTRRWCGSRNGLG